jgi:alkylated DNA repair dioxygenase AlkB
MCLMGGVLPATGPLFEADVPAGFYYRDHFISADEEVALVAEISRLEFATFEMRGVVARRRVLFFGRSYDSGRVSPPLPAFLAPLRDRVAGWANLAADAFAMALINEYSPGAPIGWHRDAPQYGIVAGISLLSSCRMKFRPYVRPGAAAHAAPTRRAATHVITLQPRSAYLMTEQARNAYEHHIPAALTLRYSVTFRTVRT